MDESGIHSGSRVCVVAGFVAPLHICTSLEREWRKLLKAFNLKYFHAKDFSSVALQGLPWLPISAPAKTRSSEEFVRHATNIITAELWKDERGKQRAFAVAAAVHVDDFRARILDERRWLTGGVLATGTSRKWRSMGAPTKPYFLAFQQCVMDAVRFGMHNQTDKLHFVFDRQSDFETSALSLCGVMRKQHKDVDLKMGDVVFTSKESAILLQVADFMAYEAYQHKVRVLAEKRAQSPSFNADCLFDGWRRRRRLITIDNKQIEALLAQCPLRPGQRFCWPSEFPTTYLKGLPMGTKVVRFPRS
ncbi:MAG TPA: DUF3800 domain-containing protein [Acidobacteriaceae bacterium]|jgi:hypothetical protein|nr:DUF3800 domain-containing protein [Acidobacteriaceae bacterium]